MTPTRKQVGALIMRVQNAFLEAPALKLWLDQAPRRFGVDVDTCRTILNVLVDAHVLRVTPAGAYARLFPRGEFGAPRGHAHAA